MIPEDIKPEWVEKAADELTGSWYAAWIDVHTARAMARAALAAVLPEAMAEAWADCFSAATGVVPGDVWFDAWDDIDNPYEES